MQCQDHLGHKYRSGMQQPNASSTRARSALRWCPCASCIWLLHPAPILVPKMVLTLCNLRWWCFSFHQLANYPFCSHFPLLHSSSHSNAPTLFHPPFSLILPSSHISPLHLLPIFSHPSTCLPLLLISPSPSVQIPMQQLWEALLRHWNVQWTQMAMGYQI